MVRKHFQQFNPTTLNPIYDKSMKNSNAFPLAMRINDMPCAALSAAYCMKNTACTLCTRSGCSDTCIVVACKLTDKNINLSTDCPGPAAIAEEHMTRCYEETRRNQAGHAFLMMGAADLFIYLAFRIWSFRHATRGTDVKLTLLAHLAIALYIGMSAVHLGLDTDLGQATLEIVPFPLFLMLPLVLGLYMIIKEERQRAE